MPRPAVNPRQVGSKGRETSELRRRDEPRHYHFQGAVRTMKSLRSRGDDHRLKACAVRLAVLATTLAVAIPVHGADSPRPIETTPKAAPSTAWPDRLLEATWPDQPEWVAMLADILKGSQLG